MNILWIEDNKNITKLKNKFFFDSGLFEKNEHSIVTPKNFDEAHEQVIKAKLLYDLVVIDINLENFDLGTKGKAIFDKFGNISTKNDFLEEAGFHLYLELLKLGFENNRIVFLTGNTDINNISTLHSEFNEAIETENSEEIKNIMKALRKKLDEDQYAKIADLLEVGDIHKLNKFWLDLVKEFEPKDEEKHNTYQIFKKRFGSARLSTPRSIHKNEPKEFHKWLNKRITKKFHKFYEYITLRRGIIEACEFYINKINSKEIKDSDIIINKCTDNRLNTYYLKDYLNKLKNLLPLNLPKTEKEKKEIYYLFLKEVSSEWERVSTYNFNDNFDRFCQQEMKLLRNWTSHNQMTKELCEKDIAFFFMIAMRGLFPSKQKEINNYEKILLHLFEPSKKLDYKNIKVDLANSYYKLRKKFKNKTNPKWDYFNSLIISLGKNIGDEKYNFNLQKIKEISLELFYQNFWHGIFNSYINIPKPQKDKGGVAFFINFNVKKLTKKSFLEELAKSVYNESF